jgi:glycine/D-amino acid oxidase-like deaminating enzyme
VWPYKLVMHLLEGAVNKGANLQTNTPVTHVSEKPLSDGRWLVTTERGTIKAKKILLATNAYTSRIAPEFKDHIVPVRGICSRIVVPKGSQAPFLPQTYSIRHGPSLYDYLIPRNDGSIIVGGAKPTWWSDTSQWYNVSDDSKLIEPALPHFEGLMQRTFIGWEKSGAYPDKIWTGSKSKLKSLFSSVMLTDPQHEQLWAIVPTSCRTSVKSLRSQAKWFWLVFRATVCH